ncbi:MAG: ATP-binding protein [Ruminococcus flavefaciens]|nr:ATP-binding protein [Ruminococcus flavefaciens]
MGIYLNPGNTLFQQAVNTPTYVDKSMLIEYANTMLNTEHKELCVSRPRRFGKSMAANMLVAYYSRGCDSRELFKNLKIAQNHDFEKHLNKYNVIRLNIPDFLEESTDLTQVLDFIREDLIEELLKEFFDVEMPKRKTLPKILETVFNTTEIPFIFIIDEWDCIFREFKNDTDSQNMYLKFLRNLLKNQPYSALVYMTGILPVKKYGDQSALNMFDEYSMTNAEPIEEFTGFTEEEVCELCREYQMDFNEMKRWYDGYRLNNLSIYNPKSVAEAINRRRFDNYWSKTENYESVRHYIEMNFDGLKDKVTQLIAGEKIEINPEKFQNDMTTFRSADDILTLLVHLGYLTFDFDTKQAWIPNSEIAQEFINSIEDGGWEEIMKSIKSSDELLKATLNCNEEKVAELVDKAHSDNTSILKYNDENSLSCVISIAYYSARKTYTIERELPAGKGYADLVFRPRKNNSNPAMIVELKYDKSAEGALVQIKKKQYIDCLKDYSGEILLVGINYDKNSKCHICRIEKITK